MNGRVRRHRSPAGMVTAEAAYCALGASNTRVHCLPTTLGIDHRIINGRVYIGGNAVTDPDEIARRTEEFQKRGFYYYANWERLYDQWREKMRVLIDAAQARSHAAGVGPHGQQRWRPCGRYACRNAHLWRSRQTSIRNGRP